MEAELEDQDLVQVPREWGSKIGRKWRLYNTEKLPQWVTGVQSQSNFWETV